MWSDGPHGVLCQYLIAADGTTIGGERVKCWKGHFIILTFSWFHCHTQNMWSTHLIKVRKCFRLINVYHFSLGVGLFDSLVRNTYRFFLRHKICCSKVPHPLITRWWMIFKILYVILIKTIASAINLYVALIDLVAGFYERREIHLKRKTV